MHRISSLTLASVLLLSLTAMPVALAVGANGTCTLPNSDTTPPFTDRCYHQGVWYSPDTAEFDVLVLPPVSPYEAREWQLLEQSVDNWETGIRALGAPWLTGLHINEYMVGREPVPASALADPEVVVAVHATVAPLGMYAGAASLPMVVTVCHGVTIPDDPTTVPSWHQHPGGAIGHFRAACESGGEVCVVTDAATIESTDDRRINFDLVSHEIGHCLTLGHVGDADTEDTDDSLAYPEHDIMSYENDGLHATTMHCPSNLDVRTIEKAFGGLLGQPGATAAVAPAAAGYVHMRPQDWSAPACIQSAADILDIDYVTGADPLASIDDADGDGVADEDDACPGFDDRLDADGDGAADGCDDDDNDGPLGDLDGDGVTNAADRCPGIDDASPACMLAASTTFYLGRGTLATSSGNVDVIWGDTAFLELNLVMDETAPEFSDPAIILAPGADGTAAHNQAYEPAEWSSDSDVAVNGADIEVVWWGIEAATGTVLPPAWDVALYFDGALQPVAQAVAVEFPTALGALPTEYRVTFPDVTGSGVLSVVIDPAYLEQEDAAILYDGIDYPSRVIVGPDPVQDSDGDGVLDDVDACPGHDDNDDLDADTIPDGCDEDRDGDGVANADDAFPDDPAESADTDGDGVGDNADLCAGHDDGADWDLDGIPDGCDDRPGVEITSPAAGTTTQGTLTVTGTTPGTADVAQASIRIPALSTLGLSPDVHVEPWMHDVDAALRGVPGYHGLVPVGDAAGGILHLVVDGGLADDARPAIPSAWSLEVHPGLAARPLSQWIERGAAFAVAELPRGGALQQGLGPGTPLYTQLDGNTNSVGICTANYLWKDHEGKVWLGAAGHCFMPESVTNNDGTYDYQRTKMFACLSECPLGGLAGAQAFFEWQAGAPLDFVQLGQVGYARQNGVGQDFGIVAIPPALEQDLEPEMPVWGGPYGVNPDGFVAEAYLHYGNGVAVAETVATKARIGVGDGDGGDKTSWAMVGLSNGGDSGSAMNSISAFQGFPVGTANPAARGLLTHGYADPVTGLLPSIPISFGTTVAQAIAMAGEGGFCIELVFADQDPLTRPAAERGPACQASQVPGQVTGLVAAAGDGQVALSWQAPADNGSPITGYTVRYGVGDVRDQTRIVAGTSAVVTGLANGVVHTFSVSASNEAGEGLGSAPAAATPLKPVRFTVEVSLDGGAWQQVPGYDASAEAWQVDLAGLADGAHALEARLLDFGLERDRASVAFDVLTDGDGDGVGDVDDQCPGSDDALDLDGDGVPDACDDDRDGDGVANASDVFPDDAAESADSDGDGIGDNADRCAGGNDAADLDGDATPDACDADRDGDGHSNDAEVAAGSDPDDATSVPPQQPTCTRTLPNGKPHPLCSRP